MTISLEMKKINSETMTKIKRSVNYSRSREIESNPMTDAEKIEDLNRRMTAALELDENSRLVH